MIGAINYAAKNVFNINTKNNKYIQVRNMVVNKSNANQLQYPINIARKISRILSKNENVNLPRRMNNINRVYKKRYGALNSHYRAKKYMILKQLNSLYWWNTRRHYIFRNPARVAYMIRIGKIK